DELKLCLVTDRGQTRDRDLIIVVGQCLAAGMPGVQVREKDLPGADLARLCRALRSLTAAHGASLIVNDRLDVALAVGADGVQRTSTSLSVQDMRSVADKRVKIGASVHSLDEALAAEAAGADWLVFGPVYDTPSKRRDGPPPGPRTLEPVAAAPPRPRVATRAVSPP